MTQAGAGGVGEAGSGAGTGAGAGVQSGGGGGADASQLTAVASAYASAICETFERCLGDDYLAYVYGAEDCELLNQKKYEQTELVGVQAGLAAGAVVYHSELVPACLEALATLDCGQVFAGPPACRAVFEGKVAEGGACEWNAECQADDVCAFVGACPGSCSAKKPAGAACGHDDECELGLLCSIDVSSPLPGSVCVRGASLGEACGDYGTSCLAPNFCERADPGVPGSCQSQTAIFAGTEGAACSLERQALCRAGLTCAADTSSGQLQSLCKPRATSGGSCTLAFPDQCPDAEYCPLTREQFQAGTEQAQCLPRPGAGQPCGESGEGGACSANLRCDGAVCTPLRDLGAPCETEEVCYSDICRGGFCSASELCP